METVASSSWGDMPSDIGHLILARLPEVVEHIRFGAVCEQWYFISKEYHQEELLKSRKDVLPMLLVPSPDTPAGRNPPRLYALSYLGKYYSNLQLQLPYNSNRYNRYCGSSYGWIIFRDEINGTVTLVYPFGREVVPIHLPCLNHRTEAHSVQVHKLLILPGSTPDNYAVVAIYGETKELATIKSGEKSWVYILPPLETLPASFFRDIVFYQGHVYAVSGICMIVKVDIQARPPIVKIMQPLINLEAHTQTYLVESISSDLFLLQRLYDYSVRYNELTTVGFNIHKLKEENGQLIIHMKDLKDLNGDTFFVGDNTSMAIQSANSCMPNSIYFTDDINDSGYGKPSGPIDADYYNIEDGTIGHCYKANPAQGVSRPFWIVPHQVIH